MTFGVQKIIVLRMRIIYRTTQTIVVCNILFWKQWAWVRSLKRSVLYCSTYGG